MQPEQVDTMLREHKSCVARYEHLQTQIMEIEAGLRVEIENALKNDAIHAQRYSPIPHGTDIGCPVEDLVFKYLDGYIPPLVQGMQNELRQLRISLAQQGVFVRYVEGWTKALNERENDVIRLQMIEGMTWNEVVCKLSQQHGNVFSKNGLRKIRKSALEKIYAAAG